MIYAIVGILLIAFIAFVVLSAKAWHWVNIVFLSLCFLTAIGVVYAASKVLDARRADMLQVQKLEADLERVEKQIEQTVYGSGLSFEYDPESLRGLSERLALEKAGRGRVWENGSVEVQDNDRVFKFSGERILNPENPNALQDMTMFVFADRNFDEELYPVLFVGIMKVVGEAADSLTLEPVFIADSQEYQQPSNSWTLFEKPPTDQRDVFLRDSGIELNPDDPNLNDRLTEYRKLLVEQYIPPEVFGMNLDDSEDALEYEGIIDRIMFDGLPLVKIESWLETQSDRINNRFDAKNEEVFVRYQFNGPSNRQYDVDASGNIESDGQFNKNGQAINPALHAKDKVQFKEKDEIYVDQLTADGYQRGETPVPAFASTEPVTEISRIFRRQLNDYPYLLRRFDRQIKDYTAEITRIEQNNQRSKIAEDQANKQFQERQNLARLLQQDIDQFENDLKIVNGFLKQTRESQESLEASITQFEKDIRDKHRQIQAAARLFQEKDSTTPVNTDPKTAPEDSVDNLDSPLPGQ